MQYTFERKRFLITLSEQWSQFFEPCNWRTFQFILLEWEDEIYLGNLEFKIVLFGLGLRFCWLYDPNTEGRKELARHLAELGFERDDPDQNEADKGAGSTGSGKGTRK